MPGPGVRLVSEPGPSLLSPDKHSEGASAPRSGSRSRSIRPGKTCSPTASIPLGGSEAAAGGRLRPAQPALSTKDAHDLINGTHPSRAAQPTTRVPPPTALEYLFNCNSSARHRWWTTSRKLRSRRARAFCRARSDGPPRQREKPRVLVRCYAPGKRRLMENSVWSRGISPPDCFG